jgi:hypothetical protein
MALPNYREDESGTVDWKSGILLGGEVAKKVAVSHCEKNLSLAIRIT